jgi:hypothetical protein
VVRDLKDAVAELRSGAPQAAPQRADGNSDLPKTIAA